jgi:pimeloyl-ACP methyl ester carboxylesterase
MELLPGGDADAESRRFRGWPTSMGATPEGVFNNIECREEQAFTDIEILEGQAEQYLQAGFDELLVQVVLDGAKANTESICPFWDSGLADPAEREPAVSDVPTLLLSGEFDPITPPSWGDLAAASRSRSTHVVVPSLSHGRLNIDQCIDDIVIEFLADPFGQVDAGCVPAMETIAFVLP